MAICSAANYLFDWEFEPTSGGQLLLNGHVYWAGGRIEDTTIINALLIPSLAADYNRDGTLNAADYVLWRKNEGTAIPLANDPLGGTVGAAHYNQWRSQFGQTTGSGASLSSNSAVPEPATVWLLFAGMLTMLTARNCFLLFNSR